MGNTTSCNGACVDLSTDRRNCGRCQNACTGLSSCVQGQCNAGCASGQAQCNGACTNTQADAQNCGQCGRACTQYASCVQGQCVQDPCLLNGAYNNPYVCHTECFMPDPACADFCAVNRLYNNGVCDPNCPLPDPDCQSGSYDPCAVNGWYGDGVCDTVCWYPDPDCDPPPPPPPPPDCGG
jgi:hypothetical protein